VALFEFDCFSCIKLTTAGRGPQDT
jgi:hypothetical protein